MLKLFAVGNLGKDAEIRQTQNKIAINFSIAHNEAYKNANGDKVSKTTWLNCTLWRKNQSSLTNYLKKGVLVMVEGTPSARGYQRGNESRASLELTVTNVQLLGGSSHEQNNNANDSNASKLAGAQASH